MKVPVGALPIINTQLFTAPRKTEYETQEVARVNGPRERKIRNGQSHKRSPNYVHALDLNIAHFCT